MKSCSKICINCPAGCHLEITLASDGLLRISGNQCPRGAQYARQEITDPRRTVTAVVRSAGEPAVCIPVKSSEPVPKAMIPELLKMLFGLKVPLPVELGQILVENYRGTGIRILATRTCRQSPPCLQIRRKDI